MISNSIEHGLRGDAAVRRATLEFYIGAKEHVLQSGFAQEIDWQEGLTLDEIDARHVLQEQAWVVLSTGMRATVVAQLFESISSAFCNWDIDAIQRNPNRCIDRAFRAFRHRGKINAIATNCGLLADEGLDEWKNALRIFGPTWLMRLAYIGPVTCMHLAKNFGLDVVKPDRHLIRMSQASGHRDAGSLCELFSDLSGDRVSVVDLVLWRYATLRTNYLSEFRALGLLYRGSGKRRARGRLPSHASGGQ
jgi:hypothetical protein